MFKLKVLVVGGIASGMSIASKAKRTNKDAEVILVEKENYISFAAASMPYYVGNQFEDAKLMFARTIEEATESGIEIKIEHELISVDFDAKKALVVDLNSKEEYEIEYDRLAIATGALANRLFEAKDYSNLTTLKKPKDAELLKANLGKNKKFVIIGGGFIGIELAEQLAHLGEEAIVLERSSHLMSNICDEEFSMCIEEALKEINVTIIKDCDIKAYKLEGDRIVAIETNNGLIEADVIIESVGFRPNTQIFNDQRLKKLDNGAIIVDEYGRTSIEDVFSAGDCASVYHRQKDKTYIAIGSYANKMGRIVGENIVKDKVDHIPYNGALGSAIVQIGEYGFASTGMNENEAIKNNIDYGVSKVEGYNHSEFVSGQSKMLLKIIYDKKSRSILGGQVFGKKGAAERVYALALATHVGFSIDDLGMVDFPFSPPFTNPWEALNIAGNIAK